MNERIERGYCDPLAPVATYRARLPQQSATSAVQEWLVQVLTAICIKVLNGGLKTHPKRQRRKLRMDGQSTIRLMTSY